MPRELYRSIPGKPSYKRKTDDAHISYTNDIEERDKLRPELIAENLHIGKVALDTILNCKGDCKHRLRKALGATN